MAADLMYYVTGEEIHAGDRVRHRGGFGTVVAVSNGDTAECSPGYFDYSGCQRGIVVCDDDGEVSSLNENEPELEFLDRA